MDLIIILVLLIALIVIVCMVDNTPSITPQDMAMWNDMRLIMVLYDKTKSDAQKVKELQDILTGSDGFIPKERG